MAVINRHRAMVELARKGALVRENAAAGCVEIWHDGWVVGHLRWTTFRSMLEHGTLVELPRSAWHRADVPCYGLGKDA